MDTRYQVFLSSTYVDLKDERQKVTQTLMEMDCIPAGMELFPAVDEEQWEFIKSVIDDCDYYLLIIGGRYGSLTPEGISYTEKEYDYAISIGLKVLAFVHDKPNDISVDKSDIDPDLRSKLDVFREKVKKNRLVKLWNHATELPGLVALSLAKTIKVYPAVGWIRASNIANNEALIDLNNLRKENNALYDEVKRLKEENTPFSQDLAPLDDTYEVVVTWRTTDKYRTDRRETIAATWSEIFSSIGPSLIEHPNDSKANKIIASGLYRKKHGEVKAPFSITVAQDIFETIRIQLSTLGLVKLSYNQGSKDRMALFWTISSKGEKYLLELRTIKSEQQ